MMHRADEDGPDLKFDAELVFGKIDRTWKRQVIIESRYGPLTDEQKDNLMFHNLTPMDFVDIFNPESNLKPDLDGRYLTWQDQDMLDSLERIAKINPYELYTLLQEFAAQFQLSSTTFSEKENEQDPPTDDTRQNDPPSDDGGTMLLHVHELPEEPSHPVVERSSSKSIIQVLELWRHALFDHMVQQHINMYGKEVTGTWHGHLLH